MWVNMEDSSQSLELPGGNTAQGAIKCKGISKLKTGDTYGKTNFLPLYIIGQDFVFHSVFHLCKM